MSNYQHVVSNKQPGPLRVEIGDEFFQRFAEMERMVAALRQDDARLRREIAALRKCIEQLEFKGEAP